MDANSRLLLSRWGLIALALGMLGFAWWRRRRVARGLYAFFTAATSPSNLAIYRVVFFAAVLVDFGHDYDPATVGFYSRLPHALQTPPEPAPAWGFVLPHLPITPHLAANAIVALRVASLLAMIGLLTRTSAWIVVVLGLYVLGVPQYYGKVNHTHHLIWFATILATSRCADALSVDAILRAWWRAGRGRSAEMLEPPAPSLAYALPLRFVWILIGLIYFFPGLHKWWDSGIDWAFTDNFRNRMWEAWFQRDIFTDDAWRPLVRLDGYPTLYKVAALGAIVFELSWIFLIFTRRFRTVAVGSAVGFHLGTYFLMKIQFWSLLLNFVTFVDWDHLFRSAGHALFRTELSLGYDGGRVGHRRRVAVLRSLDLLRAVDYFDAGPGARPAWAGALLRTPLAWPIAPLLFLLTISSKPQPRDASPAARAPLKLSFGVAAVFAILLAGNILFGLKGARDGWPFTCYPTFSRVIGAETRQTDVVVLDAKGAPIAWDRMELKDQFSKSRYAAMLMRMRDERDVRKMRAFWEVLSAKDARLAAARRVEFYDVTYSTDPSDDRRELSREKVWEFDPAGGGN